MRQLAHAKNCECRYASFWNTYEPYGPRQRCYRVRLHLLVDGDSFLEDKSGALILRLEMKASMKTATDRYPYVENHLRLAATRRYSSAHSNAGVLPREESFVEAERLAATRGGRWTSSKPNAQLVLREPGRYTVKYVSGEGISVDGLLGYNAHVIDVDDYFP